MAPSRPDDDDDIDEPRAATPKRRSRDDEDDDYDDRPAKRRSAGRDDSKRVLAGVLGILFGGFGVHKFVLGYTGTGLVMLLVSVCTCFLASPIMHVIGLVEGIIYLTKSDDEFYETYVANQKTWF